MGLLDGFLGFGAKKETAKFEDGGEVEYAKGGSIDDSAVNELWEGYAEAVLFSATDSENEPLDSGDYTIYDFDEKTEAETKKMLRDFYKKNKAAIEESELDLGTIGGDIWYARAGHGVGFFDRGLDKEVEEKLTKAAKALGEYPDVETYDGKISVRGGRVFKDEYAEGGHIGFKGLADKVAKRYEGKRVQKKYQAEYGKTYSKAEAAEVGQKVAGKVYREQQGMMAEGGVISGVLYSPALKNPAEYLKSMGAILDENSYKYTTSNGIDYCIGTLAYKHKAIVVAIITDEAKYLLTKEDLREMAANAKALNQDTIELYTNYGLELHSKYETPKTVGFDKIYKVMTKEFEDGGKMATGGGVGYTKPKQLSLAEIDALTDEEVMALAKSYEIEEYLDDIDSPVKAVISTWNGATGQYEGMPVVVYAAKNTWMNPSGMYSCGQAILNTETNELVNLWELKDTGMFDTEVAGLRQALKLAHHEDYPQYDYPAYVPEEHKDGGEIKGKSPRVIYNAFFWKFKNDGYIGELVKNSAGHFCFQFEMENTAKGDEAFQYLAPYKLDVRKNNLNPKKGLVIFPKVQPKMADGGQFTEYFSIADSSNLYAEGGSVRTIKLSKVLDVNIGYILNNYAKEFLRNEYSGLQDFIEKTLERYFDNPYIEKDITEAAVREYLIDAFKNPEQVLTKAIKEEKEIGNRETVAEMKEAIEFYKQNANTLFETSERSVEDNRFNYSLLDRLRSDCDYFLDNGNRSERGLWAGSVDAQIEKMKALWNIVPEKPEWLSMEDILEYERKMKEQYATGGQPTALTYKGDRGLMSYQKDRITDTRLFVAPNGTNLELVSMTDPDSSTGINYAIMVNGSGLWSTSDKEKAKEAFEEEIEKYKMTFATGGQATRADEIIFQQQHLFDKISNSWPMPNGYSFKDAKQVWETWVPQQRSHFLEDHFGKQITPTSQEEISKKKYNFIPAYVKAKLAKHVSAGQYAKGGNVINDEGSDFIWKKGHGINGYNVGDEAKIYLPSVIDYNKEYVEKNKLYIYNITVINGKISNITLTTDSGLFLDGYIPYGENMVAKKHVSAGQYKDGGAITGSNRETGEKYGVVVGSLKKSEDGTTKLNVRTSYSARLSEEKLLFDEKGNLLSMVDYGYTTNGKPPSTGSGNGYTYNLDKKGTLKVLSEKYTPSFAKKIMEAVAAEKGDEKAITLEKLTVKGEKGDYYIAYKDEKNRLGDGITEYWTKEPKNSFQSKVKAAVVLENIRKAMDDYRGKKHADGGTIAMAEMSGQIPNNGVDAFHGQHVDISPNVAAFTKGGSVTMGDLNELIAKINEDGGGEFSLGGAYGYQELWAKDKDGNSHRVEVGSKKDIYEALVKNRYNKKYNPKYAEPEIDDSFNWAEMDYNQRLKLATESGLNNPSKIAITEVGLLTPNEVSAMKNSIRLHKITGFAEGGQPDPLPGSTLGPKYFKDGGEIPQNYTDKEKEIIKTKMHGYVKDKIGYVAARQLAVKHQGCKCQHGTDYDAAAKHILTEEGIEHHEKMADGGEVKSDFIAYHGSNKVFDKFDKDKIGTGETGSVFGKGFYLTDNIHAAKFYAEMVARKDYIQGYEPGLFGTYNPVYLPNVSELTKDSLYVNVFRVEGKILDAEKYILDEDFSNYIAPKYKKHIGFPEKFAIDRINYVHENKGKIHKFRGELDYVIQQLGMGNEEMIEDIMLYFKNKGYDGVKYPSDKDYEGEGFYNYVIFNPEVLHFIKSEKV